MTSPLIAARGTRIAAAIAALAIALGALAVALGALLTVPSGPMSLSAHGQERTPPNVG